MQSEPASSLLLNFTKHGVHVVPDLDAKHSWPSLTNAGCSPATVLSCVHVDCVLATVGTDRWAMSHQKKIKLLNSELAN
jgi:hypothetical protein